ncbi:MAG: DUF4417 domain-containing protein [Eubacteriales bacterium]|nr:DUF4417 domain-containing protein [Eubacteriales bacterium]MDD3882493.1 DUF4417 domain-containing protein [Eubacteriales bacterium]MDD4512793.1 DUF4417 domain-containing protein [Eubacteriales bacterium]
MNAAGLRLWTRPTAYISLLKAAGCVIAPDFSLYSDVPFALNIYSHYRKHWCGAYWQKAGIIVIPTICWAGRSSFEYCFDGEPENSIVSVSSVGTQRANDTKAAFMLGYDAMLERLKPECILFFGNVPKECRGNIIPVEAFYKSIERRSKKV